MAITEEEWPTWPGGEKGTAMLDVIVDKPVDDVFLILYSGTGDFKVRLRWSPAQRPQQPRRLRWVPALTPPARLPAPCTFCCRRA
jgi:hypothetical protein